MEDWEKQIISLSETEGTSSKNPVMAFPWNCNKRHSVGFHEDGHVCHCDDGSLCEHRAKWLIDFIQSLRKSDMEAVEEMIGEDEKWDVPDEFVGLVLAMNTLRHDLRSKLKEYREKNNLV